MANIARKSDYLVAACSAADIQAMYAPCHMVDGTAL